MTVSLVVSDEFSPSKKQNVLLIGSGGVGTVASVALEKGGHAHVTSVLRSDYEKVKEHGFSINSVDHGKLTGWRPSHVVNSVEKAVEDLKQYIEPMVHEALRHSKEVRVSTGDDSPYRQ